MQEKQTQKRRKHKWGEKKEYHCQACGMNPPFCWVCRCGFQICAECMKENLWGMSCNGITWTCPDCGQQCGFGNQ